MDHEAFLPPGTNIWSSLSLKPAWKSCKCSCCRTHLIIIIWPITNGGLQIKPHKPKLSSVCKWLRPVSHVILFALGLIPCITLQYTFCCSPDPCNLLASLKLLHFQPFALFKPAFYINWKASIDSLYLSSSVALTFSLGMICLSPPERLYNDAISCIWRCCSEGSRSLCGIPARLVRKTKIELCPCWGFLSLEALVPFVRSFAPLGMMILFGMTHRAGHRAQ